MFPSEHALARRFSVSRSLITTVVSELEREGLVSRRQGRGTFLTPSSVLRKIGVLFSETATSEYYSRILRAISGLAQKNEYSLLFAEITATDSHERAKMSERTAQDMIRQRVSGVIFEPLEHVADAQEINRRILDSFDRAKIPVVLCDCDFLSGPARSEYDVVGVNNVEAGAALLVHLQEMGARRVMFLTVPNSARSHQDRLRGALLAIAQSERKRKPVCTAVFANPYDSAALRRAIRACRPDAVMCGNDMTAALLVQALREIGISVPKDMLVTGFNDVSISRLTLPTITTVCQPCEAIAKTAFDRLLARIADPKLPPADLFLPARLIVRESSAVSRKVTKRKVAKK